MAVLIPALGSRESRMTSGERRLAEWLEQKLADDYLLWCDVPMGPRNTHPDFWVMHPCCVTKLLSLPTRWPTPTKKAAPWATDMAILCHGYPTTDLYARALEQRRLPFNMRKRAGDFNPGAKAIQIMTMKVSKGLEFSVVALPGVEHMPAAGEDEQEAARVFYVVATSATQRLLIIANGRAEFGRLLVLDTHDGVTSGLRN